MSLHQLTAASSPSSNHLCQLKASKSPQNKLPPRPTCHGNNLPWGQFAMGGWRESWAGEQASEWVGRMLEAQCDGVSIGCENGKPLSSTADAVVCSDALPTCLLAFPVLPPANCGELSLRWIGRVELSCGNLAAVSWQRRLGGSEPAMVSWPCWTVLGELSHFTSYCSLFWALKKCSIPVCLVTIHEYFHQGYLLYSIH